MNYRRAQCGGSACKRNFYDLRFESSVNSDGTQTNLILTQIHSYKREKQLKGDVQMTDKKIKYVEPADYFPKSLRKKYKLGEYAEPKKDTKKETDKKDK